MTSPIAPPPPGWAAPGMSPKRPVKTWDVVVTSILLVLLAVLSMVTSFFGALVASAGVPT